MTSIIKAPGDDKVALFVFGGIADGIDIPRFEFCKVTAELKATTYYIRDMHQAWYQKGIEEKSNDVFSTLEYLRKHTKRHDKVVMCGNSMGGFAALLFGAMLRANRVLAFSPQTIISKRWMEEHKDARWKKYLNRVYQLKQEYINDVFPLVKDGLSTAMHIWYASDFRPDVQHATRLRGLANVNLCPVDSAHRHRVVKHLRDSGCLKRILRSYTYETD